MSKSSKTVLITGASRGIGKAIAEAFAREGCNLILTCSRSADDLQAFARALEQEHGISCWAVRADAGCEADITALFSGITELDILINNAGISHIGLLTDMSADDWHRVISVNLDSCFYTCRASIPLFLKKHSGKIINISSVWGAQGASMEVAYSASKGGMNAFTKALAKELAPSGIQVNAIACGVIDTAMNSCFSAEELNALKEEIPADRLGTPEEVARLVVQTASAPEFLTGQVITIDGGWF